ncbi:MAG TPA: cytidylate kinase family protein [Syntrophales bacterium]|nr:cytidylate kinase family protein [Syntrophales bacterium]HPQ42715.1 cytidylate kinase family protein [Syntrophales bacterium]
MALITITAGIGCGGSEIARRVAEGLGIPLYDDETLRKESIALGLSPKELKSLDEKAPGFLSRVLELHPQSYLELLEAVIYDVSHRGDGVIIGHGAPFLLRDFGCALHVRIYSSEETRLQKIISSYKIGRSAALKTIRGSDSSRRGFMHYAFGMDWDDPALYDLIINRDKLGTDAAADLLISVARSEIINTCSLQAMETMQRFSLKKLVETSVKKTSLGAKNMHVEVPERGVVVLTGLINPLESKDALLAAIRAVPGVTEVREELAPEKMHDI